MAKMESKTAPVSLSSSSEFAMNQARRRAVKRAFKAVPEVSTVDVLVGIFLVHPQDSELKQLLEHAGASLPAFYDELRKDGGFTPDEMPEGDWLKEGDVDPFIRNFTEVEMALAEGDKLARERNPEKERFIRTRDLFGGLLLTENEASRLIARALSATPISLDDVRQTYPEFLERPSADTQYADFLHERHPAIAFSDYEADTAGDVDLVRIGPEVNAMAYLIAAKSLNPPMAIGLFGDWGSGKSFFMRALKRRIHKITEDARESRKPQKDIDVYKYVVQIEFNAWHYVEGELWASLVEHILRNLQIGARDSETELQRRKQHWIEELRKVRQKEWDIKKLKDQLESELNEKREEIKKAEAKVEKSRRELDRLTTQDVWEAISLSNEERSEMCDALDATGLGAVRASTGDLVAALNESRELLRRGNVLIAPLRASGLRGAVWVIALLGVVFAGPLATIGLSKLAEIYKLTEISKLTEAFTTLGGFVTALAAAVAGANGWIRKWLDRIEAVREKVGEKRAQAESQLVQQIADLRTKHVELTEVLEEVKREGERKRREIRELEQELDGLTPGRALLDFINERVGSEDYRKHLGVAALIRRDFEKLSELIDETNKSFEKSDDGKPKPEDEHRINRIVLYIDDLDRCPSERVVKVLQAVHLLMAFPLFVVVVAVDARWLAESLRGYYEMLFEDGKADVQRSAAQKATPHDYLEKIFQIPFWIKPLPEAARVRILQGLVAKSLVHRPGRRAESGAGVSIVQRHDLANVVKWDAQEPERPLKQGVQTEFRPQSLEIRQEELEFMEGLKRLLGHSPRSVKRFVNVYRLIKASIPSRGLEFVSDRYDADFKLVLFLLAVVTGLSSISRRFFRELTRMATKSTAKPHTLADLVASFYASRSQEGKPEPRQARATTELERLKHWLDGFDKGHWKKLPLSKLAKWVPSVARFSYRIETV